MIWLNFAPCSPFCPALLITIIKISRQCRIKCSIPSEAMRCIYNLSHYFPSKLFNAAPMDKLLTSSSAYALANLDPHVGFSTYLPSFHSQKKQKNWSAKAFSWGSTYIYNTLCFPFFLPSKLQLCNQLNDVNLKKKSH